MEAKDALVLNGDKLERIKMGHGIKRLVIPEGITGIGKSAFSSDSTLEEVVLPSSVKKIEKLAFAYCYALKKIYIPNSVEIIEEDVFEHCEHLEIYLEGEPKEGWIEKKEKRMVQERCITPEDDAFNFHRSSGAWSYTTYEHEAEVTLSWNPDHRKVHCFVTREEF